VIGIDHSSRTRTDVKKTLIYNPTFRTFSWLCAQFVTHRGNFTITSRVLIRSSITAFRHSPQYLDLQGPLSARDLRFP
jgi:hypothetical protein